MTGGNIKNVGASVSLVRKRQESDQHERDARAYMINTELWGT
jgi:hypothetical protein